MWSDCPLTKQHHKPVITKGALGWEGGREEEGEGCGVTVKEEAGEREDRDTVRKEREGEGE